MIFDRISNLDLYTKNDEKLAAIAEFLKANPAETLSDGRHELGMGIYANVSTGPLRDEGPFEAHRKYADLQLMVEGCEIMEWAHLSDMTNAADYSEENDVQFFDCLPAAATALKVYPGLFAIFYPQDGHKPLIRLEGATSRKVIFKIPVNAMLRAAFFDFDGVLTTDKYGSVSIAESLSKRTGLPADRIRAAYQRHNGGLLRGEIEHEQMWDAFCADLGVAMPLSYLTDAARETPLDAEMLALVRELRSKGVITGMITDNPASRVEEILDMHNLRGLFDVISVSGAIGSRKDQPEIFKRTLATVNLPAADCIFIDNTAANLIVPAKMGMNTFFFDDEKRDMAALRKALG